MNKKGKTPLSSFELTQTLCKVISLIIRMVVPRGKLCGVKNKPYTNKTTLLSNLNQNKNNF